MTRFVALVPPVPALLPEYGSASDPVAELRKAVLEAIAWLAERSPARVVVRGDGPGQADVARDVSVPLARRVAASSLDQTGFTGELVDTLDGSDAGVLVLANGSARRGEKAPGHLDGRAFAYDALIEQALADGDRQTLRGLDSELGSDLMTSGIDALKQVAMSVGEVVASTTLYADDPFGVRYWVVTWECAF
jgi:hypothetical protein